MKALLLSLILFGMSAHAAPPADLIGKWGLSSRICAGGSQVDVSHDPQPQNMRVTFGASQLVYERQQGACTMSVDAAYDVSGSQIKFRDPKLTLKDSCTGTTMDIQPFPVEFKVQGNALRLTLDPLSPGACPAGEKINYDFIRI